MRIGRVGKEARSTEISTGGELWHGFERDQGKFPSWYSGVKNTEATLFGQGLSPQALNKCYSVCWQWTLAGTRDVRMDTDKEKVGENNIPFGFLSLQTCFCLWLLSKATYNSAHGPLEASILWKREKVMGISWGHVYGVPAKEDELHRKSTCELDLLKMSWRILWRLQGTIAPKPRQQALLINRGDLLSTT